VPKKFRHHPTSSNRKSIDIFFHELNASRGK
jgi:hypothetical protein